jgi:hypothetical protein
MMRRLAVAFAMAALVAGCGAEPRPPATPPAPPFYEIASAEGAIEGWLLGTIHALPDDTQWRTEAIDRAVAVADVLVVEIVPPPAAESSALFQRIATTPGQPALSERIGSGKRSRLAEVLAAGSLEESDFTSTETWAAAIMLAQVTRHGENANGVDRAMIAAFDGRAIEELEGLAGQLAIFDRLPEQDQRDMLGAVVASYPEARQDPGRLTRAWLAGDVAAIEAELSTGMLADPELYDALLAGRNRAWLERLEPMLAQPARPLVAVGAAHLVGPDGLIGLFEARGYTVRRIR